MSTFGSLNERRRKYGFFGGRTLAVAVVTAVAALSFSLGYYAGSSGMEGQRAQEVVNVVPEGAGLVLLSGGESCKEVTSEGTPLPVYDKSPDTLLETIKAASVPKADSGAGSPEEPVIEPVAPAGLPDAARRQSTGEGVRRSAPAGQLPSQKPAALEPADDETDHPGTVASPAPVRKAAPLAKHAPAAKTEPVKKAAPSASAQPHDGRAYGVQVGAFKSLGDAQAHKRRFSGKGYKASVYKDRGSDGGDIFKVRIGPFPSRDEAEGTARKLKDAEGVNAFVTPIE